MMTDRSSSYHNCRLSDPGTRPSRRDAALLNHVVQEYAAVLDVARRSVVCSVVLVRNGETSCRRSTFRRSTVPVGYS